MLNGRGASYNEQHARASRQTEYVNLSRLLCAGIGRYGNSTEIGSMPMSRSWNRDVTCEKSCSRTSRPMIEKTDMSVGNMPLGYLPTCPELCQHRREQLGTMLVLEAQQTHQLTALSACCQLYTETRTGR